MERVSGRETEKREGGGKDGRVFTLWFCCQLELNYDGYQITTTLKSANANRRL